MIRVLIVDDSAVVRKILTEELSKFADIEVVGGADPQTAGSARIPRCLPAFSTSDHSQGACHRGFNRWPSCH